jgi:multidrug efflux system membrane fusion protein
MNRRWWIVLAVSMWAGVAAPGCQQAQSGPAAKAPQVVWYAQPITRVVTDYEEFPGQTEAIFSVQVRARVSGYMTQVYFKDGVPVETDDKLFEIDPRMYKADLDRARGTVAQYEAHVRRLEKEYGRAKHLLEKRSISQEEHDRYEADYKEATANLEVARANRDLAALNLEWTEVKAPISGLLSRRLVDPGNLIKADDTVLTSIVSLDPLYVYFDVHEQAMLRLKRLMSEGKVKVKAQGDKDVPIQVGLSDEEDFPHEGRVDFTDNRIDLNTGTLRFRGRIANPADRHGNRFIVPGLFVRVRLPIGDPHPALLIPEQSLVTDQGRKEVWLVRPKKDAQQKPITNAKGQTLCLAVPSDIGIPGVLRDGYREVPKGVAEGDWVVTSGMQRIRIGSEVWAEKAPPRSVTDLVAAKPDDRPPGNTGASASPGAKIAAPEPAKDLGRAPSAVRPAPVPPVQAPAPSSARRETAAREAVAPSSSPAAPASGARPDPPREASGPARARST